MELRQTGLSPLLLPRILFDPRASGIQLAKVQAPAEAGQDRTRNLLHGALCKRHRSPPASNAAPAARSWLARYSDESRAAASPQTFRPVYSKRFPTQFARWGC